MMKSINFKYVSIGLCFVLGIVIGLFFFDYNTAPQPFELDAKDWMEYSSSFSCAVKVDDGSATINAGTIDIGFRPVLNGEEIGRNPEIKIGAPVYYSVNLRLKKDDILTLPHGCSFEISSETGASGTIFLEEEMKTVWFLISCALAAAATWLLIWIWDFYWFRGIHFKTDTLIKI